MKENEAPEKIYIPTILVANTVRYKGEGYIEYTRTDAFIEKAWDWIENNILSSNQRDKSLLYYEQFKKCTKGE
jgi:hypothetical protein